MTPFIPADEYVADTVAIVLYLEKRRLGPNAQTILDSAENANTIIYIPAMVFAEILYLTEKRRITTNLQELKNHMQDSQIFTNAL